jgi:hypothetical protein
MTEREKHEAIVIAAFDVAHSMFEQAVLAWDFFGDDERKKIIDAVLAESKRVGLAGRAESQNRTIDELYGMGKPNPPRKSKCPECGGTHFGDDKSDSCDMTRDRRGGWRQLGVYEG